MGIHTWSKSAALTLLVVLSFDLAHAATRKTVNHGQTSGSIVAGSGSSFTTPNGESAYFGSDYVDQHTAGNRFKAGDVVPSSSGKISVKVTPVAIANRAKVAAKAVASIKGGAPGVIATAAIQWAIEQIPSAIVVDGMPAKKTTVGQPPAAVDTTNGTFYWKGNIVGATPATGALKACIAANSNSSYMQLATDIRARCYMYNGQYLFDVHRYGSTCPVGYSYDGVKGECYGAGSVVPFTDSDWQSLEDVARQVANSDWTRELMKKSCEGSIAPQKCLDGLADLSPMKGPASQKGPKESSTTTTQNPDGSTSTKTETTQTEYNYNYGDNYYNYSSTTTKTTTKDGQTTTETTTDAQPPGEAPNRNEDDKSDEDWDISFQDSEFPAVTPFYEQKYPEGLSGVWQDAKTKFDESHFMAFLQSFIPQFSGSCPSWSMSFDIASWASFGTHSFGNLCYVFDFVKVIILVTALFTARAITFGG